MKIVWFCSVLSTKTIFVFSCLGHKAVQVIVHRAFCRNREIAIIPRVWSSSRCLSDIRRVFRTRNRSSVILSSSETLAGISIRQGTWAWKHLTPPLRVFCGISREVVRHIASWIWPTHNFEFFFFSLTYLRLKTLTDLCIRYKKKGRFYYFYLRGFLRFWVHLNFN